MSRVLPIVFLVAGGSCFAADPGAFDWPQWRGPDRTGISKETGLLKEWPKDGPKQLWKAEGLGEGYSTPSVSRGSIYLVGTKGEDEYLVCLNEKDGTRAWDVKIGQRMKLNRPGPRSTPTIDGEFAYVVCTDGNFVCVELAKHEIKWQKNYRKDFTGIAGSWGYSDSPLVDGDVVIGTPGGDSATIVALKKSNGDVVWKSPIKGLQRKPGAKDKKGGGANYSRAGYSSPVVAEIGGVKQYVQFLDGGVVGIQASDGRLLWHYEGPANTVANCSTPLIKGDFVFAASGYGNGGGQAKITKAGSDFKAEETYFVRQLQNHHGGMVLIDQHIYGTSGSLLCVDFETGKIAWDDRSVGKGSVTYADGHLYVRSETGKIALVEANPKKYVEKSQFMQPDISKVGEKQWPHPVIANGKLLIRDWDILLCYDVKNK